MAMVACDLYLCLFLDNCELCVAQILALKYTILSQVLS